MLEAPQLQALAPAADGGQLTRSRTAHGSSQFKGVSWSSRSGKWRAQMWFGTKVGARPAALSSSS